MSSREDHRRGEAGLRKKAAMLASVIALLALVVGSLFGDRGILHLMSEREKADRLAAEVEELRSENARLAAEIEALASDPLAIERLAREELGLAAPGETVFVIREDAPADRR